MNLKGARVEIEGGLVATDTRSENEGAGNAGSIEVEAEELRVKEGGRMSSMSEGRGNAGKIELFANQLSLSDGGKVSVGSLSTNGGDVLVYSDGNLQMDRGELTASAGGNGGSIRFRGSASIFLKDSLLSAEAGQDGGNIEVSAPETLVLHRSGLVANAIQGDGGNISIMAEGFLPSRESVISASSEFGLEGSIEIETPETNVGGGLVELPERLVGAEVNLSDRCALMLSGDVSSFFLNGDEGVPVWSSVNYVPSVFLGDEDREE